MAHLRASLTLAGLLPLLAMAPGAGFAQDAAPQPAVQAALPPAIAPAQQTVVIYTTAQLDQMLAPIALYPDTLLTQILMASTYPIQIVEAERWLGDPNNAALHGDALVAALQPLQWDPSVKSLVPFPQILKELADQLEWTQSMGTAFTNQQADVMVQVQVLRHQSESAGKLVSTQQQRVVHEGPAVVIEPTDPAMVYVPVYNPVEVYGPWAYAAYPPYYFPPYPGFYVGPVGIGIGFSVGFGVVGPLWGWGSPGWGSNSVFINSGRYSQISYNHAGYAGSSWHHAGAVGTVGSAAFHGPGANRAFSGTNRAGAAAAVSRGVGNHGFSNSASRSAAVGNSRHAASARSFSNHSQSHFSSSHGNSAGTNRGAQSHGLSRANQVAGAHGQAGRANAASHQAASHNAPSHSSGSSHAASQGNSGHHR